MKTTSFTSLRISMSLVSLSFNFSIYFQFSLPLSFTIVSLSFCYLLTYIFSIHWKIASLPYPLDIPSLLVLDFSPHKILPKQRIFSSF